MVSLETRFPTETTWVNVKTHSDSNLYWNRRTAHCSASESFHLHLLYNFVSSYWLTKFIHHHANQNLDLKPDSSLSIWVFSISTAELNFLMWWHSSLNFKKRKLNYYNSIFYFIFFLSKIEILLHMSSIKLQKWVYNLLCMDTFAHLSCLLPLQIRQRQFTCQIECAKLFIPLHYFFHQISQKFDLSTFKEQFWWCGFTVGLLSTQSL